MYRITDEHSICETAVWSIFFLLKVSTALKGTHNYIFSSPVQSTGRAIVVTLADMLSFQKKMRDNARQLVLNKHFLCARRAHQVHASLPLNIGVRVLQFCCLCVC